MKQEIRNSDCLVQIVYVSAANVHFREGELTELLKTSRRNNSSQEITGVLLFENDAFFQVLEGPSDAVEPLYQRIGEDDRHRGIVLIVRRWIKQRNFSEWSMGFVREFSSLEATPGFVDFFQGDQVVDLEGDSLLIGRILERFKNGKWHPSSILEDVTM